MAAYWHHDSLVVLGEHGGERLKHLARVSHGDHKAQQTCAGRTVKVAIGLVPPGRAYHFHQQVKKCSCVCECRMQVLVHVKSKQFVHMQTIKVTKVA